ncbi:unnamed protein product [Sphagnum tenellum]
MAPRKLRQALGVVKDQTSISIAKVAGTKSPDLDVALVKACSHDEFFDDRYVEEVLHLTSLSRGYINACVVGLNRRLTKTHNWIVALKSLMLIHRLLRDGDPVFEQEMLRASRHGMRMLNLSYFRDDSDPHAWDYSSFVRTFGLFLDDLMQQLLERVLGCRPTGAAKTNSLVQIALYPVVKESFQLYADLSEGTTMLLEGFFEMEQRDTVKAYDIYNCFAKQSEELHNFYNLCRKFGIARSSEYPTLQKISQEHLDTMEDFLKTRKHVDSQGSKSPEPQPLQLEYRPETPQPEPTPEPQVVIPEPEAVTPPPEPPQVEPESVQTEGDLLDLDKPTISQQDQENRLALALFSVTSQTTSNSSWEAFASDQGSQLSGGALQSDAADSGKAGWELALVASVSNLSKPTSATMSGGFDPLLLTSMYDQGATRQKQAATAIPAGSASSVCIPNRPSSSFLALPAPPGAMPLPESGEDPFAASVSFMKLYNNPYMGTVPQNSFGFHHYGVGMPIGNY